jgi:hypothetical protein
VSPASASLTSKVTIPDSAPIRVRVGLCISAFRTLQMPRAAFNGAARNALVRMYVFPRAWVPISAALLSRSWRY